MLLFLSIVLSMLLVLRALNVFQPKLKSAPQRAAIYRRDREVEDIEYEKVER
ncbi:MAG TPA: hypothetical protein VK750_03055 [Cytophagaceae bacterium]|jgi:hypothetical protein|nr:hypothetical protein [Cytophagaceae bacterium]